MKEVTLWLPRTDLRDMLNGKTRSMTFNTDELGFPLRINLVPKDPEPVKKFGGIG